MLSILFSPLRRLRFPNYWKICESVNSSDLAAWPGPNLGQPIIGGNSQQEFDTGDCYFFSSVGEVHTVFAA